MNAFGEALNLVFMRWSWDWVLVLCQWTQDSDCIPWVPIPSQWISECLSSSPYSLPMKWISGCIPMSSYSQANESQNAWVQVPIPVNLRLHSHEFLFPSQWISECIPWVPIPLPMKWISGCIPMSSYLPAKFWSLLVGYHHVLSSLFRNAPRIPSVASRTRF